MLGRKGRGRERGKGRKRYSSSVGKGKMLQSTWHLLNWCLGRWNWVKLILVKLF